MFRRRRDPDAEEAAELAAIGEIRELLQSATAPAGSDNIRLGGVVWFCVCESMIDEMPCFVICDGAAAGTISWQELSRGRDVNDVSDEGLPAFGGHVNPVRLRDCLISGAEPYGGTWGDAELLGRLQALIHRS